MGYYTLMMVCTKHHILHHIYISLSLFLSLIITYCASVKGLMFNVTKEGRTLDFCSPFICTNCSMYTQKMQWYMIPFSQPKDEKCIHRNQMMIAWLKLNVMANLAVRTTYSQPIWIFISFIIWFVVEWNFLQNLTLFIDVESFPNVHSNSCSHDRTHSIHLELNF